MTKHEQVALKDKIFSLYISSGHTRKLLNDLYHNNTQNKNQKPSQMLLDAVSKGRRTRVVFLHFGSKSSLISPY